MAALAGAAVLAGIVIPSAAFAESSADFVGLYPQSVALSPDESIVYVASARAGGAPGFVSAVDAATGAIIGQVDVGVEPRTIVVSPSGDRLYVASLGAGATPADVTEVDTATLTAVRSLDVGAEPEDLLLDGDSLFVTNRGIGRVARFDLTADPLTGPDETWQTNQLPTSIVKLGSGLLAVALSEGAGTSLAIIDPNIPITFSTQAIGSNAYRLTLSPDGSTLYVSHWADPGVAAIDTSTWAETAITAPDVVQGVSFSPDGTQAFLTGGGDPGFVELVDVASATVLGSEELPFPRGVAATSDGRAFIALLLDGTVSLVGAPIPLAPAAQTVVAGDTATFTATIRATWDTIQWQVQAPGGGAWTDVPGGTSTTLAVDAALLDNGAHYRYIATSTLFGSATSAAALLTVTPAPLPPTGADPAPSGLAAGLLLLVGLTLVLRARRLRRS